MSYSELILSHFPVGYWRLGEDPGSTVAVDEVEDYDGAYTGDSTLGTSGAIFNDDDTSWSKEQGAVNTTGVDMDNSALGITDQPYTFECWLRRIDVSYVPNNDYMLSDSYNNTYNTTIRFVNETTIGGWHRRPDGSLVHVTSSGLGSVDIDEWHHAVLTWDGDAVTFYLDGVQAQQITGISDAHATGKTFTRLRVGYAAHTAGDTAYGFAIDEPAIYDRALTPEEIELHYEAGIYGAARETVEESDVLSAAPGDAAEISQHDWMIVKA